MGRGRGWIGAGGCGCEYVCRVRGREVLSCWLGWVRGERMERRDEADGWCVGVVGSSWLMMLLIRGMFGVWRGKGMGKDGKGREEREADVRCTG